MEPYAIDLEPEQVVTWLSDQSHLDAFNIGVRATRSYEVAELRGGKSARLSDSDLDELGDVVEVGLLEVFPAKRPGAWKISLRMEDDLGPRLPEDDSAPDEEEEIDLRSFIEEFVRGGRGVPLLSAEAEDAAAGRQLAKVLKAMGTAAPGA